MVESLTSTTRVGLYNVVLALDADSISEAALHEPLEPLGIPLKVDHLWSCTDPARVACSLESLIHLDGLETRDLEPLDRLESRDLARCTDSSREHHGP